MHVASGDEGVRGHVASEGVIVPGGGHMGNDGHGATGTCGRRGTLVAGTCGRLGTLVAGTCGRRGTLVAGTCLALGAEYNVLPGHQSHMLLQGPETQLAPRRGTESACFN